jgi:hypothetical protein
MKRAIILHFVLRGCENLVVYTALAASKFVYFVWLLLLYKFWQFFGCGL